MSKQDGNFSGQVRVPTNVTAIHLALSKGFTMVDGLCAIQILQRPFARRGLIAKGGLICLLVQ
jgi:hypothetical protein